MCYQVVGPTSSVSFKVNNNCMRIMTSILEFTAAILKMHRPSYNPSILRFQNIYGFPIQKVCVSLVPLPVHVTYGHLPREAIFALNKWWPLVAGTTVLLFFILFDALPFYEQVYLNCDFADFIMNALLWGIAIFGA